MIAQFAIIFGLALVAIVLAMMREGSIANRDYTEEKNEYV